MAAISIRCTVCGDEYGPWFDTCPTCADAERRKHARNRSEIAMNVAEEHRCPKCGRLWALKFAKMADHTTKRCCKHSGCGYQDRVNYWIEDVRSW